MLRLSSLVSIALLVAVVFPVLANDDGQISVEQPNAFAEQRAKVDRDLADGETYSEISPEDRKKVRESLDRIQALLAASNSIEALNERDKAELFNEQEQVNTILTQAGEDSRVVCQRTKRVGSNRAVTMCETVAERRRMREQNQDDLMNQQRYTCDPRVPGSPCASL